MLPEIGQEDPSVPILITVRVIDAAGAPIAGARVEMQVFDDPRAVLGQQEPPPVVHETYTTRLDGTFDVRYGPTPRLQTLARAHDGAVLFTLFAILPDRSSMYPFGLRREVARDGWAGEPVIMDIIPGDRMHSRPLPSMSAPLPAGG